MLKFQCLLFVMKQSYTCYNICMTVPLSWIANLTIIAKVTLVTPEIFIAISILQSLWYGYFQENINKHYHVYVKLKI